MALNKITYSDKVSLNPQPSIANENKVSDSDMNEIKSVVNASIDEVETKQEEIKQQTTAPSSPTTGDLWLDTDEATLISTIDSEVSTTSTNAVQNQAITNYINNLTNVESVNPSDYITLDSSFTLASGSPTAYKVGNLVFYNYDIIAGTFNNGETQIGTCTNKLKITSWGTGRLMVAYPGTTVSTVSIIAIPNGAIRVYSNMSNGTRSAGTIILLVND